MSAHTSRPWRLDGDDQGQHALLGVYIAQDSEGGGRIAKTFANCLVTTDEECRANARLIAAAPELLEAARKAEEWLTDPVGSRARVLADLRTAIARAESA